MKTKRLIAIILAVVLVVGVLPVLPVMATPEVSAVSDVGAAGEAAGAAVVGGRLISAPTGAERRFGAMLKQAPYQKPDAPPTGKTSGFSAARSSLEAVF